MKVLPIKCRLFLHAIIISIGSGGHLRKDELSDGAI